MSGASLFDISVQHQHACLMMRLDHAGFAVGVEIASKAKVDRENLSEKLKHEYPKQDLVALCKELPGEATIGFEGEPVGALDLSMDQIAAWSKDLEGSDRPFLTEVLVPRDEEILATDGLIGTASEYVSLFLPMFDFLAWSPTNDHKKVTAVIEEVKVAQKKAAPSLKAGDRVVMMSGLFAGRAGYIAEIEAEKGKAKVMVGPVSVSVDVKDLKSS
jgi:transcription antitermination factor NusG